MQNLGEALSLMIVGMVTVFFILFLIVLIGNVIVRFSNKYLPEEKKVEKTNKQQPSSDNIYAAINAAINVVTNGKGKVTNIKKI